MITVLADHNIEGHAALLWSTMATSGWLELNLFRLVTFAEVGLSLTSSDRAVWQFVQARELLLLTGNRNMDGTDSLEQVIREENYVTALPVLTIGSLDRMVERSYREACADRLVEIGLDLDIFRGAGRLYLP
jgi:hypothetical protein